MLGLASPFDHISGPFLEAKFSLVSIVEIEEAVKFINPGVKEMSITEAFAAGEVVVPNSKLPLLHVFACVVLGQHLLLHSNPLSNYRRLFPRRLEFEFSSSSALQIGKKLNVESVEYYGSYGERDWVLHLQLDQTYLSLLLLRTLF